MQSLLYPLMDQQENSRTLNVLLNHLSSHIAEGAAQTQVVSQLTQSMVPPDEYETMQKLDSVTPPPTFTEQDLMVQLDRLRLLMEAEIQWQDFATGQLQELISDSDELVRNVSKHYAEADQVHQEEKEEMKQRMANYTEKIIGDKIFQLESNIQQLTDSLAAASSDTATLLENLYYDEKILLDTKFTQNLSRLVDSLNQSFNAEVHKNLK